MNKINKILLWIIALLVVLNLTTIGTIMYHNFFQEKSPAAIVLNEGGGNPLNGKYFRQTLGFSDKQMGLFRQANHKFQPHAQDLIIEIDSLKAEMFAELNKPTPDSLKLNALSENIGEYHTELKKITNDFYLTIKSVCDPAQEQQLQRAFHSLYKDENVHRKRGLHPQHRFGRRRQYINK